MHNINPTLIHGQTLNWVKSNHDVPDHQLRDVEVRVYDQTGAGFYFVRGQSAYKWYRDDDPTDGHFNNCELNDVQQALDNNGRVQVVGYRGQSFGVFKNWDDFKNEINKRANKNNRNKKKTPIESAEIC